MEFHEAADLFPLLDGSDFETFKEDIRANGQQEPIDIHQGKILDGRNRYRACRELEIEPKTREVADDIDPVKFVLSRNLHRRHLTTSQRAMIGARAMELYRKRAKERQKEGGRRGGRATGHRQSDPAADNEEEEGKLQENSPEVCTDDYAGSDVQAREEAATDVKVSDFTVQQGVRVLEQPVLTQLLIQYQPRAEEDELQPAGI